MGEDDTEQFEREVAARIARNGEDEALRGAAERFRQLADEAGYEYNFTWMGLPVIQHPQDLVAVQELVWRVRPAVIVETGVARGGSSVFLASMLALLGGDRRLISVEIDLRPHNRRRLEAHPMFERVTLVEGSSIDPEVVRRVTELARGHAEGRGPVMVCLDSAHGHDHVLAELRAYAPLVGRGSYLVVFDSSIAHIARDYGDRPWGPGDNPATAVAEFLKGCERFEVDRGVEDKLLITSNPGGYLRCVRDP